MSKNINIYIYMKLKNYKKRVWVYTPVPSCLIPWKLSWPFQPLYISRWEFDTADLHYPIAGQSDSLRIPLFTAVRLFAPKCISSSDPEFPSVCGLDFLPTRRKGKRFVYSPFGAFSSAVQVVGVASPLLFRLFFASFRSRIGYLVALFL